MQQRVDTGDPSLSSQESATRDQACLSALVRQELSPTVMQSELAALLRYRLATHVRLRGFPDAEATDEWVVVPGRGGVCLNGTGEGLPPLLEGAVAGTGRERHNFNFGGAAPAAGWMCEPYV